MVKKHELVHATEKQFKCNQCDKAYKAQCNLSSHIRVAHGPSADRPYQCAVCNSSFKSITHFDKHQAACKRSKGNKLERKKLPKDIPYIDSLPESFLCSDCGLTTTCREYYKTHVRTHDPEFVKKQTCPVCDKYIKTTNLFRIHMKKHAGVMQAPRHYVCELCGKNFGTRTGFKYHKKKHLGEMRFECPHCGKRFNRRNRFADHVRIHTQEKPYKCNVCSKTFSQYVSLYAHRRNHVGSLFDCDRCKKSFLTEQRLKEHPCMLKDFI